MPPEWFDTMSAPPAAGMDSRPRTSARKYRLMTGPTQFAICRVNPGSHLATSGLSAPSLMLCMFPLLAPATRLRIASMSTLQKRECHIRR